MLYANPLKSFLYSTLIAATLIGFAPLTHATDTRIESHNPNVQPEPNQPQQQATPTKPTSETEPVDDDDDTALA